MHNAAPLIAGASASKPGTKPDQVEPLVAASQHRHA
jgi:hypothetical protein